MAYVTGGAKPTADVDTPAGCPFCLAPTKPADEGLVVARGRTVFAVLNLYPYNPGHLMVCPYRHVADYTDLDQAETVELAQFTQIAMIVVRRVSGPDGFNVGMNQGHVAGAGIAGHLHQHVVPRWSGDTNFMPIIARTKTLPQLLADTRRLLAAEWESRDAEVAPAGNGGRSRKTSRQVAATPAASRSQSAAVPEPVPVRKSPKAADATKPPKTTTPRKAAKSTTTKVANPATKAAQSSATKAANPATKAAKARATKAANAAPRNAAKATRAVSR
jgi:ATP adenylyltransferase